MIEAERIGNHAAAADQAKSGLHSSQAAQRRRRTDRASRVAAERGQYQSSRESRSRATAGPSREVFGIPRVARGGPGQVERRSAVCELVGCELAHEDGAGIIKLVHDTRVHSRHVVCIGPGVAGRANSRSFVNVFDTERNTVQRPAIAAFADLDFGLTGLNDGLLGGNRDERVNDRVDRFDPRQQSIHQFERRQLARLDQARGSCNGVRQVRGHQLRPLVGPRPYWRLRYLRFFLAAFSNASISGRIVLMRLKASSDAGPPQ